MRQSELRDSIERGLAVADMFEALATPYTEAEPTERQTAVARAAAAYAARANGVPIPEVRWFREASEYGDKRLEELFTLEPAAGGCNHDGVIWLHCGLDGLRLCAVVAHEVRHTVQPRMRRADAERDADGYEIRFMREVFFR